MKPPRYQLTTLLSGFLLFVALTPVIRAQPSPDSKWTSSEPHESQAFGSAVSISGTVAAVAAPGYDPDFKTLDYGAAYVYRYDGSQWIEEQTLTKPQPDIGDFFGRSVALAAVEITDGLSNTLLVGMSNDEEVESGAGAAYVYQFDGSTWEYAATLSASDGAAGDNFSYALAGDLDTDGDANGADFIVGAPRHNLTGFNREGAAYIYSRDNGVWVEATKLTASDPSPAASFGESVAISGDRALIGAPGDDADGVGQNAGAAYVFEYEGSTWVETAKLTASDADGQAAFGGTVAIDGDRALIGARLDNELGGGAGAAYVFYYDGSEWIEEQKLTASDNSGFDLFGAAVALDGIQAVVGAQNWASPTGDGTGKAYLFTYDADLALWEEQDGFIPDDGGSGDHFGSALALDDGVVLVGARDHGQPVGGNGAVYVYGEPMASSAEGVAAPERAALSAAAPNPFRAETRLTLTLARSETVRVSLFDLLGREVRLLYDGLLAAHTPRVLTMQGEGLPSGVYIVRVTTPTFTESRNVVVQR